jgi:hypothetical protein
MPWGANNWEDLFRIPPFQARGPETNYGLNLDLLRSLPSCYPNYLLVILIPKSSDSGGRVDNGLDDSDCSNTPRRAAKVVENGGPEIMSGAGTIEVG